MKYPKSNIPIFLTLAAIYFSIYFLPAQQPFTCLDQLFIIGQNGDELIEINTPPGSSILDINDLNPDLGVFVEAAGFRSTDGLIYAIGHGNNHLYQMDATGAIVDLGQLTLNTNLSYLAGEMTPDGQFLVAIGSDGTNDTEIVKIDFQNNYAIEAIPLSGFALHSDIAFDPISAQLFGFDSKERKISTINLNSGNVNLLSEIDQENEITGVYFNAFGELNAFGTALNGVVSAIFLIDKITGEETLHRTTGLQPLIDVTACPYTIGFRCEADPQSSFPCNEIQFVYSFSNATNTIQTGIDFLHELPTGHEIINVLPNSFGGLTDQTMLPNALKINDIGINTGINTMKVNVYIDDIPSGTYLSKARLDNLASPLGPFIGSDDPNTSTFGDSTRMEINRFEEDSLFFERFLCHNQTTTLDASDYGNNLQWSNGSTAPMLQVGQAGVYTLDAVSGCQTLFVSYEVVTASCPYTIELSHSIFPDTIFPCNEVVFRYYIGNDSGEERPGINLVDTLPSTFTFVEVLPNPYGGTIKNGLPPNVVFMEGLTLMQGIDSIDVVVAIGDIVPGNYFNDAEINGLPGVLGNQRFSDDPNTPLLDETRLTIRGVESDTSFVDTLMCAGDPLWLDSRPFGTNPLWPDGTMTERWQVIEPGFYEVKIFDGCEPSIVYFNVESGADILLSINNELIEIHQGDSIQLQPSIINYGDTLSIFWRDLLEHSLSCLNCLSPIAKPLETTVYTLIASNEFCSDSLLVQLKVDDTRRVFAPNIFSPNFDGINDYFYLQSPDFATIHNFKIASRWGEIVFDSDETAMNNEHSGWDGFFNGKKMAPGVYIWLAEIEFIDKSKNTLSGDFILTE